MSIAELVVWIVCLLAVGTVGVICGYGLGKQSAEIAEQRRRDAEWDAENAK